MTNLILDSELKMSNIVNITEKRVKHLKLSELDLMLSDMPIGYKKAIVGLLKTIFTEKNEEILENKRIDLSQMIEQCVYIKMQKQVEMS